MGKVAHPKCISSLDIDTCRPQWPRGLRRGCAAARLLVLWVRLPPESWRDVSCECFVLLGGGGGSLRRADHSSRGVLPSVVCGPRPRGSCAMGENVGIQNFMNIYTDCRERGYKR
jgi:hypothetical protein